MSRAESTSVLTGILHFERAGRLAKHIKRVKQMEVQSIVVLADQKIRSNHVPSCPSVSDYVPSRDQVARKRICLGRCTTMQVHTTLILRNGLSVRMLG